MRLSTTAPAASLSDQEIAIASPPALLKATLERKRALFTSPTSAPESDRTAASTASYVLPNVPPFAPPV